jgi:hypothetical protein
VALNSDDDEVGVCENAHTRVHTWFSSIASVVVLIFLLLFLIFFEKSISEFGVQEALCDLLDVEGKESLELAMCKEAGDKSPRAFWAFQRLGYLQVHLVASCLCFLLIEM